MMKLITKSVFVLSFFCVQIIVAQGKLPFFKKTAHNTQLLVGDKPFIILGGELGNSSATTIENMEAIWPKLKAMNLNTVLVPVYWELIEKEEGKFDFKLLEDLIKEARKEDLKLVFLWFGSWKNSMSSHAPAWVKLNENKYPRVKDDKGKSHEILSSFNQNNLEADLNAFTHLMQFIKDFDEKEHTIIMIQVENEIGMLPSARDYHPLANEAFKREVPKELMIYLEKNKKQLVPEFFEIWKANGFKTVGNWESVFGKSTATDEIFMAWFYSKFTNKIAEAGKKIHPLPMFVNAALNAPNKKPGEYPSAGPLPHLMDIWKAGGNAIDMLSPDFYNPDFKQWNDLFSRQENPLFIPEHRFDATAAAKAIYAIGHYQALGFSPFSIESVDKPEEEPLGKMYGLLQQLSPIISENQGNNRVKAILFDKKEQETIIQIGDYECTFRHDYSLNWAPEAKNDEWPTTAAIVIQTAENEFYIAGSGVVVTFKSLKKDSTNAGILSTEEGSFVNNKWHIKRYLNGDQTHQGRHIRIPAGDYLIQKFKLYSYK